LPTPHDPSDTPNAPLPAPDEDDTGRFRPGTLSPVDDQPGVRANRLTPLAFLWSRIGAFDRLLLLAEAVCALVVAWLVAQYIYTVYFDSAPRRVTPASSASLAPASRRSPAQAPTTPPVLTLPGMWEDDPQAWGRTPVAGAAIQAPRPTATPTIDPDLLLPTRLRIPVMFLDSPVHEVTVNMGTWEVSPMQIGHHQGTANPGDVGNVVLAGHRDINSALFRELDRLKPGDEIFVSNSFHEYKYVVTESFVVGPTHTEVMDPTNDKRVTLITCTPIGLATQRLIVTAILDER
jgi:sortase A